MSLRSGGKLSPIANVSLLIQVLLVGKADGAYLSNSMRGSMAYPKTGSISLPVTNFRIFGRLTLSLLPAEK